MAVENHFSEKETINPTSADEQFFTPDEKTIRVLGVPPSTNRGVTTPKAKPSKPSNHAALSHFSKKQKNEKVFTLNKPKFDWFEGRFSTETDIEKLLNILHPFLDGHYDEVFSSTATPNLSRPQRGYGYAYTYYSEGEDVLTLSYGGQNGQYGVYFKTTGQNAPSWSKRLLNAFNLQFEDIPDLTTASPILVTRVDVAVDIRGDNAKIFRKAQQAAKKTDLKLSCAGSWTTKDPLPDDAGRTLYLQATRNIQMRIYEKGKEQVHKYGLDPKDIPLDWVRVEVQFRAPDGSNSRLWKDMFSRMSPIRMLKTQPDFIPIFEALTSLELSYEPVSYSIKKEPLTIDKFANYLASTYYDKMKQVFETSASFELLTSLYGYNFTDYPPILQSEHLRKFLNECEVTRHGDY